MTSVQSSTITTSTSYKAPTESTSSSKIIEYTQNKFASLFTENRWVTFPANHAIKITKVDRVLLWRFITKGNQEGFADIIHTALLPMGLNMDYIDGKSTCRAEISLDASSITLYFETEFKAIAKRNSLITTIATLIKRMESTERLVLSLKATQTLAFTDIPLEDLTLIMNASSFLGYFETHFPDPNFCVSFKGESLGFERKLELRAAILSCPNSDWELHLKPKSVDH